MLEIFIFIFYTKPQATHFGTITLLGHNIFAQDGAGETYKTKK